MSETSEDLEAPLVPEWPPHLPECCPPDDAQATSGELWYFVFNTPPIADDFLSAKQRDVFPNHPPCERAGLSCYRTKNEMMVFAAATAYLKKKFGAAHAASAILTQEHGALKATPHPGNAGHHTLWLRAAALAAAPALFRVAS